MINSAGTIYGNELSFTTPESWELDDVSNPNITYGSVTDDDKWVALKTGAYRWYNDDAGAYKNLYGALYNWFTVNTGKLCPSGWPVPNDEEWKQLEMTLGMAQAEADSYG